MEITQQQFDTIGHLLYELTGIELKHGKEALVEARLAKRMRALGIDTIEDYMHYVESDRRGAELTSMIDSLTTNKTSFFRESVHFDFLRNRILPGLAGKKDGIKIWSAGCSSGQEPYSLAILLLETMPSADIRKTRILATDISGTILEKAQRAIYDWEQIVEMPRGQVAKYFDRVRDFDPEAYRVKDNVRELVRFARLNLMEKWPMKGPFDVIFCRNVMIYFDKPTTRKLVGRFTELLAPGGHLFVGHSESMTGAADGLRYVQPAVYMRTA